MSEIVLWVLVVVLLILAGGQNKFNRELLGWMKEIQRLLGGRR